MIVGVVVVLFSRVKEFEMMRLFTAAVTEFVDFY